MALALDSQKNGSGSVNGYLCGMAAGSFSLLGFCHFCATSLPCLLVRIPWRSIVFISRSATAAAAWIITYGLSAYSFGGAFANLASPAAVVLGLAATLMVLATPVLILRYERSLLVKVGRESPGRSESLQGEFPRVLAMNDASQQGRRCLQRAIFADAASQPRIIMEHHPAELRLPAISQWPDTVEGGSKCSAVR